MNGKELKGTDLPLLDSLLPVKCRREKPVRAESCARNAPCLDMLYVCARAESLVLTVAGMNLRAPHMLLVFPLGVQQGCCIAGLPVLQQQGLASTKQVNEAFLVLFL